MSVDDLKDWNIHTVCGIVNDDIDDIDKDEVDLADCDCESSSSPMGSLDEVDLTDCDCESSSSPMDSLDEVDSTECDCEEEVDSADCDCESSSSPMDSLDEVDSTKCDCESFSSPMDSLDEDYLPEFDLWDCDSSSFDTSSRSCNSGRRGRIPFSRSRYPGKQKFVPLNKDCGGEMVTSDDMNVLVELMVGQHVVLKRNLQKRTMKFWSLGVLVVEMKEELKNRWEPPCISRKVVNSWFEEADYQSMKKLARIGLKVSNQVDKLEEPPGRLVWCEGGGGNGDEPSWSDHDIQAYSLNAMDLNEPTCRVFLVTPTGNVEGFIDVGIAEEDTALSVAAHAIAELRGERELQQSPRPEFNIELGVEESGVLGWERLPPGINAEMMAGHRVRVAFLSIDETDSGTSESEDPCVSNPCVDPESSELSEPSDSSELSVGSEIDPAVCESGSLSESSSRPPCSLPVIVSESADRRRRRRVCAGVGQNVDMARSFEDLLPRILAWIPGGDSATHSSLLCVNRNVRFGVMSFLRSYGQFTVADEDDMSVNRDVYPRFSVSMMASWVRVITRHRAEGELAHRANVAAGNAVGERRRITQVNLCRVAGTNAGRSRLYPSLPQIGHDIAHSLTVRGGVSVPTVRTYQLISRLRYWHCERMSEEAALSILCCLRDPITRQTYRDPVSCNGQPIFDYSTWTSAQETSGSMMGLDGRFGARIRVTEDLLASLRMSRDVWGPAIADAYEWVGQKGLLTPLHLAAQRVVIHELPGPAEIFAMRGDHATFNYPALVATSEPVLSVYSSSRPSEDPPSESTEAVEEEEATHWTDLHSAREWIQQLVVRLSEIQSEIAESGPRSGLRIIQTEEVPSLDWDPILSRPNRRPAVCNSLTNDDVKAFLAVLQLASTTRHDEGFVHAHLAGADVGPEFPGVFHGCWHAPDMPRTGHMGNSGIAMAHLAVRDVETRFGTRVMGHYTSYVRFADGRRVCVITRPTDGLVPSLGGDSHVTLLPFAQPDGWSCCAYMAILVNSAAFHLRHRREDFVELFNPSRVVLLWSALVKFVIPVVNAFMRAVYAGALHQEQLRLMQNFHVAIGQIVETVLERTPVESQSADWISNHLVMAEQHWIHWIARNTTAHPWHLLDTCRDQALPGTVRIPEHPNPSIGILASDQNPISVSDGSDADVDSDESEMMDISDLESDSDQSAPARVDSPLFGDLAGQGNPMTRVFPMLSTTMMQSILEASSGSDQLRQFSIVSDYSAYLGVLTRSPAFFVSLCRNAHFTTTFSIGPDSPMRQVVFVGSLDGDESLHPEGMSHNVIFHQRDHWSCGYISAFVAILLGIFGGQRCLQLLENADNHEMLRRILHIVVIPYINEINVHIQTTGLYRTLVADLRNRLRRHFSVDRQLSVNVRHSSDVLLRMVLLNIREDARRDIVSWRNGPPTEFQIDSSSSDEGEQSNSESSLTGTELDSQSIQPATIGQTDSVCAVEPEPQQTDESSEAANENEPDVASGYHSVSGDGHPLFAPPESLSDDDFDEEPPALIDGSSDDEDYHEDPRYAHIAHIPSGDEEITIEEIFSDDADFHIEFEDPENIDLGEALQVDGGDSIDADDGRDGRDDGPRITDPGLVEGGVSDDGPRITDPGLVEGGVSDNGPRITDPGLVGDGIADDDDSDSNVPDDPAREREFGGRMRWEFRSRGLRGRVVGDSNSRNVRSDSLRPDFVAVGEDGLRTQAGYLNLRSPIVGVDPENAESIKVNMLRFSEEGINDDDAHAFFHGGNPLERMNPRSRTPKSHRELLKQLFAIDGLAGNVGQRCQQMVTSPGCPPTRCGHRIRLVAKEDVSRDFVYECEGPVTHETTIVRHSFFGAHRSSIESVATAIWMLLMDRTADQKQIKRQSGLSERTIYRLQMRMLMVLRDFFRVFSPRLDKRFRQNLFTNRHGQVRTDGVEMDEMKARRRKYHRGRNVWNGRRGSWIVGFIRRSDRMCYLQVVENRNRFVMARMMMDSVPDDQLIFSDEWKAYAAAQKLLHREARLHRSVNHSENFVHPDDPEIHTQMIENLWKWFRRDLGVRNGTRRAILEGFCALFMWRQMCQATPHLGNAFYRFFRCVVPAGRLPMSLRRQENIRHQRRGRQTYPQPQVMPQSELSSVAADAVVSFVQGATPGHLIACDQRPPPVSIPLFEGTTITSTAPTVQIPVCPPHTFPVEAPAVSSAPMTRPNPVSTRARSDVVTMPDLRTRRRRRRRTSRGDNKSKDEMSDEIETLRARIDAMHAQMVATPLPPPQHRPAIPPPHPLLLAQVAAASPPLGPSTASAMPPSTAAAPSAIPIPPPQPPLQMTQPVAAATPYFPPPVPTPMGPYFPPPAPGRYFPPRPYFPHPVPTPVPYFHSQPLRAPAPSAYFGPPNYDGTPRYPHQDMMGPRQYGTRYPPIPPHLQRHYQGPGYPPYY